MLKAINNQANLYKDISLLVLFLMVIVFICVFSSVMGRWFSSIVMIGGQGERLYFGFLIEILIFIPSMYIFFYIVGFWLGIDRSPVHWYSRSGFKSTFLIWFIVGLISYVLSAEIPILLNLEFDRKLTHETFFLAMLSVGQSHPVITAILHRNKAGGSR